MTKQSPQTQTRFFDMDMRFVQQHYYRPSELYFHRPYNGEGLSANNEPDTARRRFLVLNAFPERFVIGLLKRVLGNDATL